MFARRFASSMLFGGRNMFAQRPLLMCQPIMGFRNSFKNPYIDDPTPITQDIREAESTKPVWDRTFDHKKYMQHEGPLKLSTGIAYLDVEPFPRMKLMKLYYLILQEVRKLPEEYPYKYMVREMTHYRMKVVDENMSIRAIEKTISHGLVEELIVQAHNELKLMRLMNQWRPWEGFSMHAEEDKSEMQQILNFREDNPFPNVNETYDDMRHDRKPR